MSRLTGLKALPSPMAYSSLSEPETRTVPVDIRSMMDPSCDESAICSAWTAAPYGSLENAAPPR